VSDFPLDFTPLEGVVFAPRSSPCAVQAQAAPARSPQRSTGIVFHSFDEQYVQSLRGGDPVVERHFVLYFSELITIKLRARRLAPSIVDDLRQETFLRVLGALRKEHGLEQPQRLGAFVNSVCNNVYLEFLRRREFHSLDEPEAAEPVSSAAGADALLASQESTRMVAEVLSEMTPRDRSLLRMVLLEECDKDDVCHQLQVTRDHLRVLLHRAKARFREILRQRYPSLNTSGTAPRPNSSVSHSILAHAGGSR
jgi:RNA polymerase sigma-70 factor, ECF subfamily